MAPEKKPSLQNGAENIGIALNRNRMMLTHSFSASLRHSEADQNTLRTATVSASFAAFSQAIGVTKEIEPLKRETATTCHYFFSER